MRGRVSTTALNKILGVVPEFSADSDRETYWELY